MLILAGVCAILAWTLKTRKAWLLGTVTDLIQKAEVAVRSSKMGAEKKALVIAQLEAMGLGLRHG